METHCVLLACASSSFSWRLHFVRTLPLLNRAALQRTMLDRTQARDLLTNRLHPGFRPFRYNSKYGCPSSPRHSQAKGAIILCMSCI